jgi:serine/threonine protein kinase
MSWMREPNAEPIPGYRLIEPLGSGGFGEVWKCEVPGGLHKAIKFVYGNLNSLDVDGVRAEQELKSLQRIKEVRHPFVLSLDRIEVVEGELVIVMELADKSLYDLFSECQAAGLIGIPRDDLLRYLRDTAEALDHMNEKHNLQHLDVKPRNLFLISDRVKVADFGLVKHLERQSASGLLGGVTPLYAPPETFNGKITITSDQYSLAIVYQELLTGQRPFTGKNVRQLAQQHLQGVPELRALPEAERPIVARSLSKDPAKRFPNCMAFIRALYQVRQTIRREVATATPAPIAQGVVRPKSLSETMEDFQLEVLPAQAREEEVDLGASPPEVGSNGSAVSELGITVAQPQTGSLRPTLIVGVGGFGRKAIVELRCRFIDRFGDLSKLPLLRFLCLDPDPEAVNSAVHGAPEVALTRTEVFHLPLQPVGNYRRRMLDQLNEWLPREKLYALPRSLQTQGSRALGRLSFVDNQQRLLARFRRDIQEIVNPDNIYQSVSQTSLALRDMTPRIYVIASAGGGSSGMLTDLGYALRRLLAHMRHPDAELTCLIMCGAPSDPATPKAEQANIYATLTELNHYHDPSIPFAAQYGVDGQRLVDQGSPFGSVYLLPLANRSPDALNDTVSHLGSYLFHELTTPLGLKLDQLRHRNTNGEAGDAIGGLTTPFRSFGTYAVWFPRGLLLRLASRMACKRLLEGWLATEELPLGSEVTAQVDAVCQSLEARSEFQPESVWSRIEEAVGATALSELGGTPLQALTGLLATLEEQSLQHVAQEDPANWGRQAVNRVREWVGMGDSHHDSHDWRKTKLNRGLAAAAQKVAEDWDQQLSGDILSLMENPGARLSAAEAAVTRLQRFCLTSVQQQRDLLDQQASKTLQVWQQLEASLHDCISAAGGGFRLFGGKSHRRVLRAFTETLALYARQRLNEEMIVSCRHFYHALHARLSERLRDMGFCRHRLRNLHENLDAVLPEEVEDLTTTMGLTDTTLNRTPAPSTEAFWEAIRQSATARVVLPDGEEDLEKAAIRFLQTLTAEHWVNLDRELHERILMPRGGLHGACVNSGDLTRQLALPLISETITLLGTHLPIIDVAQILCSELGVALETSGNGRQASDDELIEQAKVYLERSAPLLARPDTSREQTFLLLPASDAGKALGEAVHVVLPELKVVRVPGQADLMFCREQNWLTALDVQRVLRPCKIAYESAATAPPSSPHARFDVLDWMPLDP